MPTHGLVPYEIKMWESGEKENRWDLSNLRSNDPDLPSGSLADAIENLMESYEGEIVNDRDREKFMYLVDYDRSGDLVEGIIAAGNHGYESKITDIETGDTTYEKDEDESEVLPYYFMFWIPKTMTDDLWNGGTTALIIFQQISGGSVKTDFSKLFNKEIMYDAPETSHSFKPATRQRVLRELIESQRVRKAHLELKQTPQADDAQTHLVRGLDQQSVETQTVTLEPEYSGSLTGLRDIAEELENTDSTFATVTRDDVSDLSVEVTNQEGRDEKFSLFDDELKMRRKLSPGPSERDHGLPTVAYICEECCYEVNRLYPQDMVKSLSHTTSLSR